jgi:hypothetical protein
MIFRRFVEFDTSIPDDTADDESGWRVGGQGVGNAIAEIVRSLGAQADDPEFEGDHGWTFDVRKGKQRYYFQVQHNGRVTMSTDELVGLFGRSRFDEYLTLLNSINETLRSDSRFSKICWVAEDEIFENHVGAPTPSG